MATSSSTSQQRIVIVGCGIAGLELSLFLLKKKRDFLIINPTDYFHVTFASVRSVALQGWANKTMIPLQPTLGDHFKMGKVVEILPNADQTSNAGGKVLLESGEEVKYGRLVIATGTREQWPVRLYEMEKEEALRRYEKLCEKAKSSKQVVVIGGGATGVEIAAEFKTILPNIDVALINSNRQLVGPFSERSQQALQTQLSTQFGIKLVLEERVTNLNELEQCGNGCVKTNKGTEIEADLIFKVIGDRINATAYEKGLAPAVEESGRLKVDTSFRVEGFPNIFAIGDCTSFQEPKIGALAQEHAKLLGKSMLLLDKGKQPAVYKPDKFFFVAGVTLGWNSAFARLKPDIKFPVFIMKKLKGQKLFTDRYWKDMRQPYPE